METPSYLRLPPVPKVQDPAVAKYLADLHRAMHEFARAVYMDFAKGSATLKAVSSAPATTDLDNNQVIVRTDAPALYTKINGVLKTVALS